MQDALAVMWRRRERVRSHPNPRALVPRVCTNAALDALRRRRTESGRMAAELPDGVAAGPEGKPDAGIEVGELVSRVRVALAQLPPRQATAVLLRVLEERPHEEIASAAPRSAASSSPPSGRAWRSWRAR